MKTDKGGIHNHVYECLTNLWDEYEGDFLVEYEDYGKVDWEDFDDHFWLNVHDENKWENGWYLIENYSVKSLSNWLSTFKDLMEKNLMTLSMMHTSESREELIGRIINLSLDYGSRISNKSASV